MSNQKTNLTKKSSIKKTILQYSAIFEPAEEGGYNVSFPQFPGCVTFGRTFEESKIKAQEVLELWIEELAFEREKIPIMQFRPIIDEVQVFVPKKALIYASNHC
ncbi:type II toxin-antitoxin system HicB family antitoxin [Patescibacteria group bacterium]|nr:type II toxin-antitoxin system HicB family antitoxin [Patescibacteria group bacterium]MBU2474776.1 type II toxin-antitoxin system HicB family antitoxin [Patescibacteria group bacterium]